MKNFTLRFGFSLSIFLSFSFFLYAQQGEWTWMKGDSAFLSPGHYGTKGVPDALNTPPAMYSPTRWKDLDGNFWFYGGYGPEEFLGDMWMYDPSTNKWTWVKGNKSLNQPAVYGTQGIPSPTNFPGCRGWSCSSWTDENGDLWLFGGRGYGSNPNSATQLSDLWRYHIATNEWTWMKGNGQDPTKYGTKQVPAVSNTPGMRQEVTADWTDDDGGLWFYGGISNNVLKSDRNDMWRYDINTNLWTWMSGDSVLNVYPDTGTVNVFSPSSTPGGRMSYCSWQDKNGIFWFFGGHSDFYGPDWCDLWKYDPSINQWAFVSGSISNINGINGALCDTSHLFFPKGRWENRQRWIDDCGNLWLFGGQRNSGSLNDLWMYSPKYNVWSYINGTLLTNNNGIYGTKGVSNPANVPGSRTGGASWIDDEGNFWLFAGAQTTSHATLRNDLWKYVPDPDCPAIHCGKVSSPGTTNPVFPPNDWNNTWIHDIDDNDRTENSYATSTEQSDLVVYPNPNKGSFTIVLNKLPPSAIIHVTVLNALQQIIYEEEQQGPAGSLTWSNEINLRPASDGIYFLEVSTWSSMAPSKIIFQKKKIVICE